MADRWDVFVAYASPDRDRARPLYQALTAAGLSVCFDEAVLRPGDNWHRELPGHLRSSAVVVALVSSRTADAWFEVDEVLLALDQVRREGARLVPLRLHPGAELPYGTLALHALDYFDGDRTGAVVDRLVDVVRNPSNVPAVPGSQVWCSRVPGLPVVFAGRHALLEHLWAATSSGGGAVLIQTIQGMGGVGKTTLAAALADARRHELDVVWLGAGRVAGRAGRRPGRAGPQGSGCPSRTTRPPPRWPSGTGWRPQPGPGSWCSTTPRRCSRARRSYTQVRLVSPRPRRRPPPALGTGPENRSASHHHGSAEDFA